MEAGKNGGEGGRKGKKGVEGRMDGGKVEARERKCGREDCSITFFLIIHMPSSHQVMIILELMANGDLRNYLKSLRPV